MGFLQGRIPEWVAISFSRGSFWPRNRTQVSCIAGRFFTDWAIREALFQVKDLYIVFFFVWGGASQVAQSKKSACNAGDTEIATYSSILAQKLPWTRGTLWISVHGVAKGSDATEWLNNNFFFSVEYLLKMINRKKIFSESCPGPANLSFYASFGKMIIPWKLEWIMGKLEIALKLEWVF